MRDIYEYIALELLVSETASEQTQRIMHRIRSLEEMPMRHQLYEEEPWHSQGIRCLPVDNYLIFLSAGRITEYCKHCPDYVPRQRCTQAVMRNAYITGK